MAKKITKSAKRFHKSKGKGKTLQQKALARKIKRDKKIKEKSLVEREFSDSDDEQNKHEQRYHRLRKETQAMRKKKKEAADDKKDQQEFKPVTQEEVSNFLNNLEMGKKTIQVDEELMEETDSDDDVIVGELNENIKEGMDIPKNILDKLNSLKSDNMEDDNIEEDNMEDDNIEEEEEEDGEEEEEEEEQEGITLVTRELIEEWIEGMKKGRTTPTKKMIVAFRDSIKNFEDADAEVVFKVKNQRDFLMLVIGCLKYSIVSFNTQLKRDADDKTVPKINKAWKKLSTQVNFLTRSIIGCLYYLEDAETLKYILKYLEDVIPFFGRFKGYSKRLLKILLSMLGNTDEIVQVRSFMVIHKMATILPYPFLDLTLKGIYYTLFANASKYNETFAKQIEFLKNCAVELYGVDFKSSYQHAYLYIRKLAMSLRESIKSSKPSLVCNWRFIHCLDAFVKMVSTHHDKESALGDLIYPVTRITLGAVKQSLLKSEYMPCTFKFIDLLHSITKQCNIYVPSILFLVELLEKSSVIGRKPSTKYPKLNFNMRTMVRDDEIVCLSFQNECLRLIQLKLAEFLALNSNSISFPEISYLVQRAIKKFKNDCGKVPQIGGEKIPKHTQHNMEFKKLLSALRTQQAYILEKRSSISFAPKDITEVDQFTKDLKEQKGMNSVEKYFVSMHKKVENVSKIKNAKKEAKSQAKKRKRPKNEIQPKAAAPSKKKKIQKSFEKSTASSTKKITVDSFFNDE